MNYELAQKLQDAGFPQPDTIMMGQGVFIEYPEGKQWIDGESRKPYAPSLSELIEACGDQFHFVERNSSGKWGADDNSGSIYTTGSTPEEAVANLWLALNPPK